MKDQNCYELNHVVNMYIMILIIYFKVKLKHKITYQTVQSKKQTKNKFAEGKSVTHVFEEWF